MSADHFVKRDSSCRVVVRGFALDVHSGRRHIAYDYRDVDCVLQCLSSLLPDVVLLGTLRTFEKNPIDVVQDSCVVLSWTTSGFVLVQL